MHMDQKAQSLKKHTFLDGNNVVVVENCLQLVFFFAAGLYDPYHRRR